jgi:hypothetical protein
MSKQWNVDIWATLAFSAAVATVVIVLWATT